MAAGPRGDGMHDPRRERVRWEGGIGGLVWQSVRNLILGILTFGLYRFWGKAATRRYVWGHVRIGDARASYHGTGLQLFGRWLIVSAAVGVPVVAGVLALHRYDLQVAVALQDLGVPFPPEMLPWLPVLPLLALVLLAPALSYWRWRYLLGCTELRGVRFGLDGSMWVYMLRSWLLWAINLGAALLLTPQVVAGQRRYLLRNVTYGALRGRLEKGAMRAPYLRFFIIWLMSAVLLTIVAVYVAGTVKMELVAGGLPDLPKLALPELGRFDAKAALDPQAWARLWSQLLAGLPGENERMVGELYLVLLAPLVGAIVGALVFVRIIGLAHEAAMLRFLTYYFWLGDCGLRSNISFGRLARLRLWNVAILALSLGALAPWTRHRTFRYVELHTRVGPTAALADAATMPGAVADSDDLVASIEAAIGLLDDRRASPDVPPAKHGAPTPPTSASLAGAGDPEPAPAAADAVGAPMPRERIRWEGEVGPLFWLTVRNFVLSVLTLTLYRFWGKTAVRRYVWSHLVIDGEPLEYTGTGGELFRSFLVVVLVVVLPLMLLGFGVDYLVATGALPRGTEHAPGLVLAPVFAVLLAYARFTGLRYRLSRTQWRGVAFGLEGAPGPYVRSSIGRWLLNAICLGLLTPQTLVRVERHRLGRVAFGSARARYAADPGQVPYLPFLVAWLAAAAFAAVAGAVAWDTVRDLMVMRRSEPGTAGKLLLAGAALYGIFIVGGLVVRVVAYWYEASMLRYLARSLSLGGCSLATNISFVRLFRLRAWNLVIIVCTFGLATAVAWHRELRYLDMHTRIGPVEALAAAAQSGRARPTRGEGLLDAFDAGLA